MKKLQYTKHLLNRLRLRKISKVLIVKIIRSPKIILFDNLNSTKIAIGESNNINYMVAFTEDKSKINILTIHPIKRQQIENRIKSGRWSHI